MDNMIKINTDQSDKQTVDARELHAFLGSKKPFRDWITEHIMEYNFVENVDFTRFDKTIKSVYKPDLTLSIFINMPEILPVLDIKIKVPEISISRLSREYHITLDMAKELSLFERNEKGKVARQYFIEYGRRAKDPMELLSDPAHLRRLLCNMSGKQSPWEK